MGRCAYTARRQHRRVRAFLTFDPCSLAPAPSTHLSAMWPFGVLTTSLWLWSSCRSASLSQCGHQPDCNCRSWHWCTPLPPSRAPSMASACNIITHFVFQLCMQVVQRRLLDCRSQLRRVANHPAEACADLQHHGPGIRQHCHQVPDICPCMARRGTGLGIR